MKSWDAKDYAQHSTAQKTWARELINKLKLVGTESILDIGCGDGLNTIELARAVPRGHVIGIDNSNDMIQHARSLALRDHVNNVDFHLMDCRKMDFKDQFDVVFSNAVLHWVKEQDFVLRGIAASLKSGGRALLQMGGRGNASDIITILDEMLCEPPWKSYFTDFDFPYTFSGPEEFRSWAEAAGLNVLRCELLVKDMVQQGTEGLAGWIRTTWFPFTDKLPESKRAEFITTLVSRYINAHPLDCEGKVHVKMVRLETALEKPLS